MDLPVAGVVVAVRGMPLHSAVVRRVATWSNSGALACNLRKFRASLAQGGSTTSSNPMEGVRIRVSELGSFRHVPWSSVSRSRRCKEKPVIERGAERTSNGLLEELGRPGEELWDEVVTGAGVGGMR